MNFAATAKSMTENLLKHEGKEEKLDNQERVEKEVGKEEGF